MARQKHETPNPRMIFTAKPEDLERLERLKVAYQLPTAARVLRKLIREADKALG